MKPGETGLKRIFNACGYSLSGLKAAYKNEAAFRQEIFLGLILFPLAIWIADSSLERVVLIGSLMLVLITELLNSAIEAVVDRIGIEKHELAGRAKDIGSAAVMISLINVLIVWGLVLWG